ncbi:MAG: hypothetical protein K2Q06_07670 [Parvularculaceae bacterium]|nr:hypothetical protein [Parvularculaceae bacterium]
MSRIGRPSGQPEGPLPTGGGTGRQPMTWCEFGDALLKAHETIAAGINDLFGRKAPMTDERKAARDRVRAAVRRCALISREIRQIEKPLFEAIRLATAHLHRAQRDADFERAAALEAAPEYRGVCETCDEPLFAGDVAYGDDQGFLCAAHAPTYGDALRILMEAGPDADEDGPDSWSERIEAIKAHDPTQKATSVLE